MIQNKIINLLRSFGWMLICYFLFFSVIGFLKTIFPELDLDQYEQKEINQLLLENPLQFFLLAVVVAPVIEEGMFRTLIKPSLNDLIFFLSCWVVVITTVFIPESIHWIVKLIFLAVFLIFAFTVLRKIIPVKWQWKLSLIFKRYTVLIWTLTSIVFGVVHVFNYVEGFELNLVLVLLIIPRIIAGFFFGKIKLENKSLVWPIAMHAMNNGLVVIIQLTLTN